MGRIFCESERETAFFPSEEPATSSLVNETLGCYQSSFIMMLTNSHFTYTEPGSNDRYIWRS